MTDFHGWNLIVNLNTDTFGSLLTTWLELQDVGTLDTAWCNRISRQRFLFSLSSIESPMNIAEYDKDDQCACWAAQRGVKVNLLKVNVSGSIDSGFHHSKIDFCGFKEKDQELLDFLSYWMTRTNRVEEIRLTNVAVDAPLFTFLLECFPRLHTLRCFSLSRDCLPLIAASNCTLRSLHIESKCVYMQTLADTGVAAKLSAISVNRGVERNRFGEPLERRALSLSTFPALVHLTFTYVNRGEIFTLIKCTPNLRHLQIDDMDSESGPKLCQAIAESLPCLERLLIHWGFPRSWEGALQSAESSEQAVIDMVLKLRHLRELCLDERTPWPHNFYRFPHLREHARTYAISKAPPNTSLRKVVLAQLFQYDFIDHLMQVCPNLSVLKLEQHLRSDGNISLGRLQHLRRLSCDIHELRYVHLANLRNLTHLDLRACDTPQSNKIGLARVRKALQHMHYLTHFAVVSTTPIALTSLFQAMTAFCPHLRYLKIHQAVETGYKPVRPADAVMESFCHGCLGLRDVDFGRTVWREPLRVNRATQTTSAAEQLALVTTAVVQGSEEALPVPPVRASARRTPILRRCVIS